MNKLIVFIIIIFISLSSQARVPPYYVGIAKAYEVPVNLFYSIALQESQRSIDGNLTPWPWTLNVCGKGEYFNSKEEALRALKGALNRNCSVDIGLFQIHWQSHYDKFNTLSQALDPIHNMRVGAYILHRQYIKSQDWFVATGLYHHPSDKRLAGIYRDKVYSILKKVHK